MTDASPAQQRSTPAAITASEARQNTSVSASAGAKDRPVVAGVAQATRSVPPAAIIANPRQLSPEDVREGLDAAMKRSVEPGASPAERMTPLIQIAALERSDPRVHTHANTDAHLVAWTKSAGVVDIQKAIASRVLVPAAVGRGMGVAAEVFDVALRKLNVEPDFKDDLVDHAGHKASAKDLVEQIDSHANAGWRTAQQQAAAQRSLSQHTPSELPVPKDAERQRLAEVLLAHGNQYPDLYRIALSTQRT